MFPKKEFVPLWLSYEVYFEEFSDAEVGRLARAMIIYKSTGAEPKFSGNERFIWPAIRRDIDNLNRAQEEKSEQGRAKAHKRWDTGRRKSMLVHASACQSMQSNPDDANENVSVNVNESVKENAKDKDTPPVAPQGAVPDGFDAFWTAYPRKVGKKDALRAWKKLAPGRALSETIVQAVERQKSFSQWTRDGGRYIPNPATWLNQGRWEDEDAKWKDNGTGPGVDYQPSLERIQDCADWMDELLAKDHPDLVKQQEKEDDSDP